MGASADRGSENGGWKGAAQGILGGGEIAEWKMEAGRARAKRHRERVQIGDRRIEAGRVRPKGGREQETECVDRRMEMGGCGGAAQRD